MSLLCTQLLKACCPCFFNRKRDLSQFEDSEFIERQQFIVSDATDPEYEIKHKYFIDQHQSPTLSLKQSGFKASNPSKDEILHFQSYPASSDKEKGPFTKGGINQDTKLDSNNYNNQQRMKKKANESAGPKDYKNVISLDHPYYDILCPKLESLCSLFDTDEKDLLEVSNDPFPLRIYCKWSEARKTNSFTYFFQFNNINYESYEQMLNNFELQKSFDSNINEYFKKVESPDNNTKVIYLSYNKVLIIAPRDFIYVRYVFKKDNEFWSIATSLPNESEVKGKIRGQIVLTATKVVEKNNSILVQVYSEVNMKMTLKPQMTKNRGKAEIKKYLQKCFNYLNQSKSENIL